MDIQHLKCLLTVLYCDSFTEAGEVIHLSQSAISKKIIALENELGIKLIQREGRHILLTSAGRRLMSHFIGIMESYDHAMLTIEEIKLEQKSDSGTLRIISVPPISRYNIISLIESFSKQNPTIDVSMEEMETDRIFLMLRYGDCDLAFVTDIRLDHNEFDVFHVKREKFMIAVSAENQLSAAKSIQMKDLEGKKLILNRPESRLYYPCVDACKAAGFVPNIMTMTTRPTIALEYLHSNPEYIYMGLKNTLLGERSKLHRTIPIADSPEFDFVFAWKKKNGLSINAAALLEYITPFLA
jgi:LysR family transcriptional activator of glutamate synthase operon